MTDQELDALLASKRANLMAEAQRQARELRALQCSGQKTVGPWAPAHRVVAPRRRRTRATVTPIRRRA